MDTSFVKYLGGLRTEAVHLASQKTIITDAPTDNHGKGEAFSPTDLMATSLANCMLTVMGIKAQTEGMTSIDGTTAAVTKVMYAEPRRVGEIQVKLTFPKNNFSDKEKKIYEIPHTPAPCQKVYTPT